MFFSSLLMGQDDATLFQDNDNTTSYWINTVPFYNMPKVKVGKYYNHKLEIKIPKDTIRTSNGKIRRLEIKNISVISVHNVPKSLSYSPHIVKNSSENYFHFYLDLYGRVSQRPTSLINVKLSVTFSINKGKSMVRTYEIKNISLREDKSRTMETFDDGIGLKSLKSYPNPLNNKTEVSFWSSKLQLVEFEVRDAIGNLKFKQTFTAKVGSNKISFSQKDLPNGLYLYSIKTDDQTLAKRLIIK